MVVRICRLGKNIPQRFAHRYYDALTIGIDFTARDLQKKASEAGQPWTICKGFDGSAAIGEWVPKEKLLTDPEAPCEQSGLQRLHFHLDIQSEEDRGQGREGKTVQEGCTSDMLYTVDEIIAYISQFFTLKTGEDEIIAYISQFFTLKTGDLLYTGTPAGVGPVHIGDRLVGWLENRQVLAFNCK